MAVNDVSGAGYEAQGFLMDIGGVGSDGAGGGVLVGDAAGQDDEGI
jgi:hypothetical protein